MTQTATFSYSSLFARKESAEEIARREANKLAALKKLPATGNEQGVSVKVAAERLGVSLSTVYRWIAKGKIQSSFKSQSKAGGRAILWISGVEIFNLKGTVIRYRESDLH